jgi:signal transduction histidine kinase
MIKKHFFSDSMKIFTMGKIKGKSDISMSLRNKLLVMYIVIGSLVLLSMGGWIYYEFRKIQLEKIQTNVMRQSKLIDVSLTDFIHEVKYDVKALAANDLIRSRDDNDFTSFLGADEATFEYHIGELEQGIIDLLNTYRTTHPYVNSVYMGRENGSFVRAHPRNEPTQYDPRERAWYILAKENPGKVMMTAPYPSVTTTDVNIGIVTALLDESGKIYGVVGADITLVNLTRFISSFNVGHAGQLLLVDEHGTILADKNEEILFSNIQTLLSEHSGELMEENQGVIVLKDSYFFFCTSSESGWKIAEMIPKSAINQEVLGLASYPPLLGLLLTIILIGFLSLTGLNTFIIKPLSELSDVTQHIAHSGNLDLQVKVRSRDEIGRLSVAFNQMVVVRKQVEEALHRERDLAKALGEAVAVLSTTLDFDRVLDHIIEQVSRIVPNDSVNIMLIQGDEAHISRSRGYEHFGVEEVVSKAVFKVSEVSTLKSMFENREPILIPDTTAFPGWVDIHGQEFLRCYAAAPIIVRDKVLGFLNVDSATVNFFTKAQLEVLSAFADHAAIAIDNAQLYEKVKRLASELEQRVLERTLQLEIARDHAEAADRTKSAFLATMSHELRTPLNSIIGFTGILLQGLVGSLNEEQNKQLNMVQGSARHLLELINDVLDISKIEAGQIEIITETFDMRMLIQKSIQTLTPMAEKKGLALSAEVDPQVGEIISDRRRVEQIMLNLLNNAVKFTQQGEVRIVSQIEEGFLVTRVIDTGIGIKPEGMKILFAPFRQIDSGISRQYEGTGLGLSISKRLVEMLGGRIWVESDGVPGKGSTFTFTLPLERRSDENQNSGH